MTLVFQDPAVSSGTHALIIGVAAYPFAKPDKGGNPALRRVKDIASAADSAKLVGDWLIDNRSNLAAPLASLEVVISDVVVGTPRYTPTHAELHGPFDAAVDASVRNAGTAWLNRIQADPGATALFYGCGHGANRGASPLLFLSDLNQQPLGNAWSHLNIGRLAQAFKQMPQLTAGFFFLDACGEFVPMLGDNPRDCTIIAPDVPRPADRDKVLLLAAASAGSLAHSGDADPDFESIEPGYDGEADASGVRLGRFTQTILKGLSGASARWSNGWKVDSMGLCTDLKPLHRTYFPHWNDKPFEPSPVLTPNDRFPIVNVAAPLFPVVISTEPLTRTGDFDLKISLSTDGQTPWLLEREGRAAAPWAAFVGADQTVPIYALALDGEDRHVSFFKADQPQFDHRVVIK